MSTRSWAMLGLLSAIWGSSYLFIALGLRTLDPAALVFVRVGVAALALTPLAVRRVGSLRGRWKPLPLLALTQVALPFVLISTAEQHVPSGLAGVLVASQPLWLVVLAPLFGTGRPAFVSVAGIAVGFGGVALLVGLNGSGAVDAVGVVLVLLAALSYAVGAWLAGRTMTGVPPVAQTWATMAVAAVLVAPVAAFQIPSTVHAAPFAAVIALGVVGTAGAFGVYNWLIKDAGPARASLVAYMAPGFALGYGALLLDEPVGWASLAGLLLVLAGSWLSSRTSWPRVSRQPGRAEPATAEAGDRVAVRAGPCPDVS